MKNVIICDVKIRSLHHSHNIRINQAFCEYFESNQTHARKYEKVFEVSKFFPKNKVMRSLRFLKMGYSMSPDFSRATCTSEVIFFPSIDFEDFLYLLPLIRKFGVRKGSHKIILRFLCIDAESFLEKRLSKFIVRTLFKYFKKMFPTVVFAAETSEGANYLSSKLKSSVTWLPTPVIGSYKTDQIQTGLLLLPGKPRWDKGSDELPDYAKILSGRDSSVLITAQSDDADQYLPKSNLMLVASDLAADDYNLMLANCQWIFSPHIRSVYRYRGSALLHDAISYEKLILCRRGTTLGNFVEKFQIGAIFSDQSDFYGELMNMYSLPDETNIHLSFSKARNYLNETVFNFFYSGS